MKKTYINPTMKVVILKSRQAIMIVSTEGLEGFKGSGGVSDVDDDAD